MSRIRWTEVTEDDSVQAPQVRLGGVTPGAEIAAAVLAGVFVWFAIGRLLPRFLTGARLQDQDSSRQQDQAGSRTSHFN
jgi:hypothetical protein